MQHILLAINIKPIEAHIYKALAANNKYEIIGNAIHKQAITDALKKGGVDIILLTEVSGIFHKNANELLSFLQELRQNHPEVRPVVLCKERKPGDQLLLTFVSMGIYDFIARDQLRVDDIVHLLTNPQTYSDVSDYHPKFSYDEAKGVAFEPKEIVTVHEVGYIEAPQPEQTPQPKEPTPPKESPETPKSGGLFEGLANAKQGVVNATTGVASNVKSGINKIREVAPELSVSKKREKPAQPIKKPETKPVDQPSPKPERPKRRKLPTPAKKQKISTHSSSRANQILCFTSIETGATDIAFEQAMALAQNNKVLFIDFNEDCPRVPIWLDLFRVDEGMDRALLFAKENNPMVFRQSVENAILKPFERKEDRGDLGNYKEYKNIDFLFFSQSMVLDMPLFINNKKYTKQNLPLENIGLVLSQVLTFCEYDYIVLNGLPLSHQNQQAVYYQLLSAHEINIVLTHDVANIIYTINKVDALKQRGVVQAMNYLLDTRCPVRFSMDKKEIQDLFINSDIDIQTLREV